MRRAVKVLMLLLVMGQALGLDMLVGEDVCAQQCPDDADGRNCPPVCPACACSLHGSPTVLPSAPMLVVRPQSVTRVRMAEAERTPLAPEPDEILRVPIAALA